MIFNHIRHASQRSEDAVIAFTWQKYVGDPTLTEWPLRLPMTKAGVKAMDVMTAWGAKREKSIKMDKVWY